MTLRKKEGFEYCAVADVPVIFAGGDTTTSHYALEEGRNGGRAWHVTNPSVIAAGHILSEALDDFTECRVGFAFQRNTTSGTDLALLFYEGANLVCRFEVSGTTGTLYDADANNVGSDTMLSLGSQWDYIEFKWTPSNAQLWINEELILDINDVYDAGAGTVDKLNIRVGVNDNAGREYWIDDLYIDDATRQGDLAIVYWVPTSDNTVDFTPSVGGDNYALVDEIPESDVDYNQSALVGDADIYGHSSIFGAIVGDVVAVDVVGYVNVPDGGVGSGLIPKLKIGGVEYDGTQVDGITIMKEHVTGEFLLSPATGVTFTQAELEALDGFGWEIGS